MAKTAPQNTLLQVSQVMFASSNMNKMQKIMENPVRSLIQLHLRSMESLTTSLVAAEGKPENLPTAIVMFFIERAEDPFVAFNILLGMGLPQQNGG
jgi:hypothetical protein